MTDWQLEVFMQQWWLATREHRAMHIVTTSHDDAPSLSVHVPRRER